MLQLNTAGLYQLMRDFYTLTRVRIVIFDAQINELLSYPQNCGEFCTLLRSHPEGKTHCRASDMSGCMQCARSKELVVYRCHAGLTEAVVPVLDRDDVLAYVMFGQIVSEEDGEAAKRENRGKRKIQGINSIDGERGPCFSGENLMTRMNNNNNDDDNNNRESDSNGGG